MAESNVSDFPADAQTTTRHLLYAWYGSRIDE